MVSSNYIRIVISHVYNYMRSFNYIRKNYVDILKIVIFM